MNEFNLSNWKIIKLKEIIRILEKKYPNKEEKLKKCKKILDILQKKRKKKKETLDTFYWHSRSKNFSGYFSEDFLSKFLSLNITEGCFYYKEKKGIDDIKKNSKDILEDFLNFYNKIFPEDVDDLKKLRREFDYKKEYWMRMRNNNMQLLYILF